MGETFRFCPRSECSVDVYSGLTVYERFLFFDGRGTSSSLSRRRFRLGVWCFMGRSPDCDEALWVKSMLELADVRSKSRSLQGLDASDVFAKT